MWFGEPVFPLSLRNKGDALAFRPAAERPLILMQEQETLAISPRPPFSRPASIERGRVDRPALDSPTRDDKPIEGL